MFWTDLTTAFRRLRRRPTYALLNGVGLTLALAACLLIGLYTWEELRVNTGYEHADRIMVMGLESSFFGPTTATPAPLAPLLEEQSPHVDRVARTGSAQKKPLARAGERPGGQYRVLPADSSFTALFSFEAVHGTVETALDQPDAAVLTERVARQYFGEQNPVGETIRVGRGEEATTRTVRAVIENPPSASTLQFDVLVPLTAPPSQGGWGRAMYGTYALLHQPMTETAFTEHVTRLVEERVEKAPSYSILATTLPDLYLSELHSADGFRGQWSYLYIFGSAALLLLLIACINYVNLATARGLQRAREIGVRKALGATRGHLARLLVGEAVILVGIASVVAVGLAAVGLPAFNGLFGTELAWAQLPLGRLALGLLGLVGVVGLGAGAYPAFITARFDPASIFQTERTPAAPGGGWLHRGLVVLQFAITSALIACTFVLWSQLDYVQSTALGFEGDQVATAAFEASNWHEQRASLRRAFEADPAVETATVASAVPDHHTMRLAKEAQKVSSQHNLSDPKTTLRFSPAVVDTNYVETLGLDLVAGQSFRGPRARSVEHPVIINETAADRLGWTPEAAVGKSFELTEGTVIGVVADYHITSLREPISPVVLQLHEPESWGQFRRRPVVAARLGADQLREGRAHLEATLTERTQASEVDVRFLDATFEAMYRAEERVATIFFVFAVLAIVVACLGLYGLAAHAVQRRTKEIGVRKVLGATVADIVGRFTKEFGVLVGVALVLGTPVAYVGMSQWLQNFAYRVDLGPTTFLITAVCALVVAGLAVGTHAARAARLDPATTLRDE